MNYGGLKLIQATHEYSNFPDEVIQKHNFKDVDDKIASVINQIKELQVAGLYNQASRVIDQNRDVLGQYIIDADTINSIMEHIRNTQIVALQTRQCIYVGSKPYTCSNGDVWIGV